MSDQQPHQQSTFRDDFNLVLSLLYSHAFCLYPFIRCCWGTNVPGVYGIVALVLMLIATAATEDVHMLQFLEIWFLVTVGQRALAHFLYLRGRQEHSWYCGWPWLAKLIPFCTSEYHAKNMEPVLCLLIGWALLPFAPGVGQFVAFGVVSLTLVHVTQQMARQRKETALRDMEIEQRSMAMRMRGSRR